LRFIPGFSTMKVIVGASQFMRARLDCQSHRIHCSEVFAALAKTQTHAPSADVAEDWCKKEAFGILGLCSPSKSSTRTVANLPHNAKSQALFSQYSGRQGILIFSLISR
jgi:hypothetical protein